MVPFYSTVARFVDETGRILSPFLEYLQQFTIAPPSFLDISVGISPFAYEAKEPGNVYINGAITGLTLKRGGVSIALSTVVPKLVPVSISDIVTVTYAVLPAIKFIPGYGQNTTS